MRWLTVSGLMLIAMQALADIVVTNQTIRPGDVISAEDLVIKSVTIPGTVEVPEDLIGQEARIALYPGRPIRFGDVGPPAIVDRNQLVTLVYRQNGLRIVTEGRALGRGAEGDVIRVMNLTSRATLSGRVNADGTIEMH